MYYDKRERHQWIKGVLHERVKMEIFKKFLKFSSPLELIQPTVEQPAKKLLIIPNILSEKLQQNQAFPRVPSYEALSKNEYFTTEALFESKDTDILEGDVDIFEDILEGEVLELLLKRASLGRTTEEGKLLIFLLPSTRVYRNERKRKIKWNGKQSFWYFISVLPRSHSSSPPPCQVRADFQKPKILSYLKTSPFNGCCLCCSWYSLTKSLVVGSGRLSSETDKRGTKASSTPMNWKKEVLEIKFLFLSFE